MNKAENIFRTPFSTALSGSARETERRILLEGCLINYYKCGGR